MTPEPIEALAICSPLVVLAVAFGLLLLNAWKRPKK